jgi:hypothetical protein
MSVIAISQPPSDYGSECSPLNGLIGIQPLQSAAGLPAAVLYSGRLSVVARLLESNLHGCAFLAAGKALMGAGFGILRNHLHCSNAHLTTSSLL